MEANRHRGCPICGTAEHSRLFSEAKVDAASLDEFAFASRKFPEYMHHRLMECAACDLVYASPIPQREAIEEAYGEADFDSGEEAKAASVTYAELLSRELSALPDRDGALDIGTGDGAFLERLLDMGFTNVAGVEPSRAPLRAASARVRPLIREGFFAPGDHPEASFRLVTCFQTLEHVESPLDVCAEVRRILKPGGLAFVVVHNRRAMSAKVLGERSPIYDVEHLQLFSPRSAVALMTKAGLANPHTRTVINKYPVHYWMKLFPLPASLKRPVVQTLRETPVGRVTLGVPAGNLAVFATKG